MQIYIAAQQKNKYYLPRQMPLRICVLNSELPYRNSEFSRTSTGDVEKFNYLKVRPNFSFAQAITVKTNWIPNQYCHLVLETMPIYWRTFCSVTFSQILLMPLFLLQMLCFKCFAPLIDVLVRFTLQTVWLRCKKPLER